MTPPETPQTYETNARFEGAEWTADVDGVPVRAASRADLQRRVRDEVIRQTGNERVLVLVNFL